MRESPLFSKLKTEGRISKNPLKESFANPRSLRYVLIALFGAKASRVGLHTKSRKKHSACRKLEIRLQFPW
jgi:hypothetical protein